jgi:hypothetical protein
MKNFRTLMLACAMAIGVPAFGQTTQGFVNTGVTVLGVDVRSDGRYLVTLSSPLVNQPACATNHVRITGDTTTAAGKALLATALMAYSTKSPIGLAQGTGTCDQYAGYESMWLLSTGSSG